MVDKISALKELLSEMSKRREGQLEALAEKTRLMNLAKSQEMKDWFRRAIKLETSYLDKTESRINEVESKISTIEASMKVSSSS